MHLNPYRSIGCIVDHVDGSMQKRRKFSALAMELRIFCIEQSIWCIDTHSTTRSLEILPIILNDVIQYITVMCDYW